MFWLSDAVYQPTPKRNDGLFAISRRFWSLEFGCVTWPRSTWWSQGKLNSSGLKLSTGLLMCLVPDLRHPGSSGCTCLSAGPLSHSVFQGRLHRRVAVESEISTGNVRLTVSTDVY